MTHALTYQFIPTESFAEGLKKYFKDEYESKEKKPLIPKEAYGNKKVVEFCQTITEAHKQILEGFETFSKYTTRDFSIEELLENFSKIAELSPKEYENQSIKQLLGLSDADYIKLYNLAAVELNKKNFLDASRMFLFLCWLNPHVYTPMMGWGLTESLLGNRNKAQEIYELCLPQAKRDPYIYIYLAENSYMLGEKSKSKDFLENGWALASQTNNKTCLQLIEKMRAKI